MRCNIFKPINAGDTRMGTFLMFSQYTEDVTKEQAMKSTYRIVPSKFVALNLDINKVFNEPASSFGANGITIESNGYGICGHTPAETGVNKIVPQIFQSYYENGFAYMNNRANKGETEGDLVIRDLINSTERNISTEILWRTLEEWGFIHRADPLIDADYVDTHFPYYPEVKYIGDINIHSTRNIGAYNYGEIYCHIPASDDEYYYPIDDTLPESSLEVPEEGGIPVEERMLEEWSAATYPVDPNDSNNYTFNRAITYFNVEDGKYYYHYGGFVQKLEFNSQDEYQPIPRHSQDEENVEYKFNAILIFYDVINSEPGNDPQYIHRFRPMGIYLSGPVVQESEDPVLVTGLQNEFVKYVSNNDAYGQGASFGLRLMFRHVPTPNMTTYTMEVADNGNDYEVIAAAMGTIADAISGFNDIRRERQDMFQTFKDHLAMFRNYRVNVPYPRLVNGEMYWFVNGRNTGQRCSVNAMGTFVFNQTYNSNTWMIQHNLSKFPSVSVVDENNHLIFSDVEYIDENNIILHFSNARSGIAYLN